MRAWVIERRRRYPRASPTAAAVLAVGIVATLVVGGWLMTVVFVDLPGPEDLRQIGEMEQATTLYDADDRPTFTIFKEQRIEVPLSAVSPHLVKALVAIEDQRFYSHGGIDTTRIVAAALANLREGRRAQGGSTITQQLVRQSFLSSDKTMTRKLREVVLAARIEQLYTKDQILEFYANKVYFGDGLYGVEAASLGYFGKHARDLSVAEAALLAGLVKSPSTYAPTVDLERARTRRNVVLQAMLETRSIDRATWQQATRSKVVLHDALRRDEPFGQYFKEAVRRELIERFGWQRVYQGGLKVYTTLDLNMQQAAEAAVKASLEELDRQRAKAAKGKADPDDDRLQAALVAMDPATGYVRAMVGGRDGAGEFNRATQARRQPGSAFKPFVYAAALEGGYTAATVIDHLDAPVATIQGDWTPEDEHSASSAMTMRSAVRTSSNRAAVQMLQRVGIATTVQYARRLGVGTLPSVPSLALGSGEVTLATLTSSYAAFANDGLVQEAVLIRRVEDGSAQPLFEERRVPQRALSEATAYIMTTMLADVINAGTAYKARRLGFTLPAAGKTGTTNDYNDAWFVGYTPHLVAGVWVGFDQPRTIMRGGYAGDVAVPLWARFMRAATKGDKADWFKAPANVIGVNVCRVSGKLPTLGCSSVPTTDPAGLVTFKSLVYTEYFVRGTEPSEICPVHGTGLLNAVASSGVELPPAPAADAAPAPGTPAMATTGQVAGGTVQGAPKKKRGFWSRIFGRGDDDKKDDGKKKDEKEKAKPPGEP